MFKMKKSSATRAFACLLILFMLLAGWAIAENAAAPEAEPEVVEQVEETPAAAASEYMPNMVADPADVAEIINTPRGNPCVGGIKALFRFLPISYNVRQGSEKNPAW